MIATTAVIVWRRNSRRDRTDAGERPSAGPGNSIAHGFADPCMDGQLSGEFGDGSVEIAVRRSEHPPHDAGALEARRELLARTSVMGAGIERPRAV